MEKGSKTPRPVTKRLGRKQLQNQDSKNSTNINNDDHAKNYSTKSNVKTWRRISYLYNIKTLNPGGQNHVRGCLFGKTFFGNERPNFGITLVTRISHPSSLHSSYLEFGHDLELPRCQSPPGLFHFTRESLPILDLHRPSFVTVTGWGVDQRHDKQSYQMLKSQFSKLTDSDM